MGSNITTKFTIEVEMQDRWIPHFLSMLSYMEELGAIGSSRQVTFLSDGDGDFRPKFSWDFQTDEMAPRKDEDGHRFYDAG